MRDFINQLEQKPALKGVWLLLLLILLFVPHWLSCWKEIHDTTAPDLLLRTIGSRLQKAGKPIYLYKWQPGDPLTWLNPYPDTRNGSNGVVSTPFLLKLLQPLSQLDYCTIKMVWGWTQELFLFSTAWFCGLIFQQRLRQFVFFILLATSFIYDRNWLLNLYNGQMYIIYSFVFAISAYTLCRTKNAKGLLMIFPVLSIIRPFFFPIVAIFFKPRKQYVLTLLGGLAIAVVLVISTVPAEEWRQYNTAMKFYAREQTGELTMDTLSPGLNSPLADACIKLSDGQFAVFGGGCLYSLQHYLYLIGVSINSVEFYQFVLAVVLLLTWWIAHKRGWLNQMSRQLLLGFLFYQFCELMTPASRNPYNMIQWLPAVAWLTMWGNKSVIVLIAIGLCLNHDLPFRFTYEREIGELSLFAAIGVFLFQQKDNRGLFSS